MLLFLVQPSVDCCRFCLPVTPGLLLPPLLPMGDFLIDNIHFAVTLAVTADYVVANRASLLLSAPVAIDVFCDRG